MRLHGFARCDDCVGFEENLAGASTAEQRAAIEMSERRHHAWVRASRSVQYGKRDESRLMSLIVDGADQVKYNLPTSHRPRRAFLLGLQYRCTLWMF
jgi:hypothetical protein